jgi:hypothetical protein
MVTRKTNNRKKIIKTVEPIPPPAASKNIMGLSGVAMIILTNYQSEIKQSLTIILGFLK